MTEKEFMDKGVIPSWAKVLKIFFEKNSDIFEKYKKEMESINPEEFTDDPIFIHLMK
jgi:hypothetical protein